MANITLSPSSSIKAGEDLTITVSDMIYGGTNSSTDYWRITLYVDGSSWKKYDVAHGKTSITKYITVPTYECLLTVEAKLYISGIGWSHTTTKEIDVVSSGSSGSGSGSGGNAVPSPTIGSLTLTPIDSNGNVTSIAIQGITRIKVTASDCYAGSGSISYYAFTSQYGSDVVYTSSSSASTTFPAPSGNGTFNYQVRVNDYSGSAVASKSIYVYQYSAPYFTYFNVYRSNSSGTANISGSYITYEYQVNYSTVANTNSPTVKIYCNGTLIKTVSGASGKYTTTSTYSTGAQHNLYAVVTDTYGGSQTSSVESVYPSGKILNIASGGESMGIGGLAPTTSGTFGCYWDANFYKNATVSGDLTVTGNLITNSLSGSLPTIEIGSFNYSTTSYSHRSDYSYSLSIYTFIVPFKKSFNSVPFVTITSTIGDASGATGMGEYLVSVSLKSVSKTQFECVVVLNDSNAFVNSSFDYMAVAV